MLKMINGGKVSNNKKNIIIGAGGMVGKQLLTFLKSNHEDVIGTYLHPSINKLFLDIKNESLVKQIINKIKPNIIYNCSGFTDVEKAEDNFEEANIMNGIAIKLLADICKNNNILLVHISTDYVFDGLKNIPYEPDDITNPQTSYGKTKLIGEQNIIKSKSRYVIIRTSWLFDMKNKNFVNTILKMAKNKKTIKVVNDQIGCPTYIPDLIKCIYDLVNNQCQGIYHFCNKPSCTWYEFAKYIIHKSKLKCKIEPCNSDEFPSKVNRPKYSVLDCSNTFKEIGWKSRSWKNILNKNCLGDIK